MLTDHQGRVIGVQGPVVDVRFDSTEALPSIYEVLETSTRDGKRLVLEVAEHLPGNIARCIGMSSTLNLQRSAPVTRAECTSYPRSAILITVPPQVSSTSSGCAAIASKSSFIVPRNAAFQAVLLVLRCFPLLRF